MTTPRERQMSLRELDKLNCELNRLTLFSQVPELDAVYIRRYKYVNWKYRGDIYGSKEEFIKRIAATYNKRDTYVSPLEIITGYLEEIISPGYLISMISRIDIGVWIHRPIGDLNYHIEKTQEKIKYITDYFL